MRGNPRQYIAEPREGLHAAPLAGCDEAQQYSCRPSPAVTAEEGPVPASHRYAPIRPLTGAVVDLQIAILEKPRKRIPLIQRVTHRPRPWTLRQQFASNLLQIPAQLLHHWRRQALPQRQTLVGREVTRTLLHPIQTPDQMQGRTHVLLVRLQRFEEIPARVHPASHFHQPARLLKKSVVDRVGVGLQISLISC